jgi:hypothetical protein
MLRKEFLLNLLGKGIALKIQNGMSRQQFLKEKWA